MHRTAVAILALLASASAVAQDSLYRVKNPTPGQRLLLQQHFDVLGNCCGSSTTGPIEVIVARNQVQLLLSLVPTAQFGGHSRPFYEIEAEALGAGTDIEAGYYTVAEIEQAIDAQVALYPGLAQKVNLSTLPGGVLTHEGRPIYALKVSDNVGANDDEPSIVIAAQHHARELNSPYMVIGAMERVLAGYATDPQLQAVVNGYELWFVPMVNPDGVEYCWTTNNMWRKNRRNNGTSFGVDLNRNYPFLWGLCGASTVPSSDTYRGPSAGSEPETVVMRNLIARLRPEIYLDFHSSGREVLRMWAPCATVHPTMDAFQERYVDDLRTPMGYGKRDPSASGESPEDHYSSGGTLSFLTEISTAFQPLFSSTIAEEAMVWPGIRRAITTWRPALRGHVFSALGGTPLVSTITFSPSLMNHGEVTKSRASDGRFGLWLPLGNWNVTWSAPGHTSRTFPVTIANYDTPVGADVALEPVGTTATLSAVGTGSLGTSVTYTYTSPGDAGQGVFFGWSAGTSPGIHIGGLRVLPLNYDLLMELALLGNPFLFPTFTVLDAASQAQCTFQVPNIPWLVGLTTYVAGVTIDPAYLGTIEKWSQPVGVTIVP